MRDIAPTAVRLSPELRHALRREAEINGRTLHAEILLRLKASLEPLYMGASVPEAITQLEVLPDAERALLTLFRRMSPERQLALLALLR